MTLMLRTSGSPAALVPGVRAAIAAIDPALPVGSTQPLEQVVSDSLGSRRFVLVLVAVLGGLALALAGIGLFGVMAYLVAQRTSELGVRLMLGARPLDVLKLVVRDGMRLVALGLALGLVSGVVASRALESQLFGVRSFDPAALVGVASALVLVSFVALVTPAWRAASIDPRGRCASNNLDGRAAARGHGILAWRSKNACPRRSSSAPTTPASTSRSA